MEIIEWVLTNPGYAVVFVIIQNHYLRKAVDANAVTATNIKKELKLIDRRVVAVETKMKVSNGL